MGSPRTRVERVADTLAMLTRRDLDAWVASTSRAGVAHLVPLSLGWDGERLILATQPDAVTTRNLGETGRARLGLGGTRDVVMVDAEVVESHDALTAPASVVDQYVRQAGWDPRAAGAEFVVHILRPVRIQAWREVDEAEGRTLMRDGRWLPG